MSGPRLDVIGASAGGMEPLDAILGTLPASLPAAVVIVVHTRSSRASFPRSSAAVRT